MASANCPFKGPTLGAKIVTRNNYRVVGRYVDTEVSSVGLSDESNHSGRGGGDPDDGDACCFCCCCSCCCFFFSSSLLRCWLSRFCSRRCARTASEGPVGGARTAWQVTVAAVDPEVGSSPMLVVAVEVEGFEVVESRELPLKILQGVLVLLDRSLSPLSILKSALPTFLPSQSTSRTLKVVESRWTYLRHQASVVLGLPRL